MSRSPYLPGTPTHQPVYIKSEPETGSYLEPPSPPLAYTSADFPTYNSISSFATDPTLLTPVSSAGSPAMAQQVIKSSYSVSPGPAEQQPTPPGSSRLYYPSYETGVSSQSSSPLSVHPPATSEGHFDMAYMPTSPKEEGPPPLGHQPYFGHYGVSEAADNESMSNMQDYPPFANGMSDGYLMRQVTSGGMMPCIPSSQSPMTNEALQPQFRPLRTSVMGDNSAMLPLPTQSLHHPFPSQLIMVTNKSSSGGSSSKSKTKRKSVSKKRVPSSRHSRPTVIKNEPTRGSPIAMPPVPVPRLTLGDQAPAEDRYLFELKYKYSDEKGKGMWDNIRHDFKERFGGEPQRATLQMRMSRMIPKYGIWPDEERALLRAAWQKHKEESYTRILAHMKEMAGRPLCWDWKPMNIETELVKMGIEEPAMDLETKTRRPTRAAQRMMAAAAAQRQEFSDQHGYVAPPDHLGVNWPGYGAANPHFAMQHQQPLPLRRSSYADMDLAPNYTSDQEEQFISQIEQKYRERPGDDDDYQDSPMSDHMEVSYSADAARGRSRSDTNHERSQQVAREACEQMMARRNLEALQSYKP